MSTDNAKQRYEFKPGQRVILQKTGETGTVLYLQPYPAIVGVCFDDDPPRQVWMIPAHKLDPITTE